jgi:Zn-dependent protease
MLRNSFLVGRLYGISIRIDWSWILILLLITWNLAATFGQAHPGWGSGLRWGLSVLAALLFFASVLAHEMAHSLVARSQGLPVRDITLFLFGGVSNIEREPSNPKNEFWMAIAGPLTSLVVGALLLLIVVGSVVINRGFNTIPTQLLSNLTPLATILLWLGSVNIILGIFNLVPGFPLDGGRVLRSILWGITHNLRTATHWAAIFGQVIAWIMIVAGISMVFGMYIPFFGTGLVSGLWLAFIGWFLNSASTQSYQQVKIKDILEGVPVARIMRSNPPTVDPDCTIDELVQDHMMNSDDQAFPVLDQDRLVGIVTLDDVRKLRREDWPTARVSQIMTSASNLVTVTPEEDASSAMEKLIERDVRQLLVVRPGAYGGDLIGLLRRQDIMRWLQLHNEDKAVSGRNP